MISEQENENARASRRALFVTYAQLLMMRRGVVARHEEMLSSFALTPARKFLERERLDALASRLTTESSYRAKDAADTVSSFTLSLDELYLVFVGLEAYEQQTLDAKFLAPGEVRALIETLRHEMIQREMDLGEIEAALELTLMGKAIMASVSSDARW